MIELLTSDFTQDELNILKRFLTENRFDSLVIYLLDSLSTKADKGFDREYYAEIVFNITSRGLVLKEIPNLPNSYYTLFQNGEGVITSLEIHMDNNPLICIYTCIGEHIDEKSLFLEISLG